MADWRPPTQDRVEGYFKELNNWGRWGHDDQRGTANLITAAKRAQASSLVRTGRTVSLARDIGPQPAIMYNVTFPSSRERADVVLDRFDLVYHGFSITHIDALCHVAWDGELYNGRSFKDSLTAADDQGRAPRRRRGPQGGLRDGRSAGHPAGARPCGRTGGREGGTG